MMRNPRTRHGKALQTARIHVWDVTKMDACTRRACTACNYSGPNCVHEAKVAANDDKYNCVNGDDVIALLCEVSRHGK